MAWYVMRDGKVHGPLDSQEIKALATQGQVDTETPISQGPIGPWVAARNVKGLFASAGSASAAPSPVKAADKCCPFCGETILAVAIKCKHCGEMLGPAPQQHEASAVVSHQAPGNSSSVALAKVEYPEIKRTCKKCGKVWFSDSQKEEMLELTVRAGAIANLGGMLAVGVNGYGRAGGLFSVDQRQRSEQKNQSDSDKLGALRRCSNCNSTSFEEIKPPKPASRVHSDYKSSKVQKKKVTFKLIVVSVVLAVLWFVCLCFFVSF